MILAAPKWKGTGLRGLRGATVVTGPDGQQRVVTDTPINIDNVLPSGENVIQDSTGTVVYASGGSLISGVPNWALGVGVVVGLVVLMKAVR